jgi:hypothetical protein
MLAALGFIPLLGPIVQGISSIFSGYFNTKIATIQAGAQVATAEIQATTTIIQATADDICLRILRDAAILPVVVWSLLIGWDTIIAENSWNVYMWHVAKYPDSISYLPYAVLVFLFGNIGINMWKR